MKIERADMVMRCHDYFFAVKRHRNKAMIVVYTNKSWVNAAITVEEVCKDKTWKTSQLAFLAGLLTGLKP
jgi:hypothetical protein